jgi:hypothetical protein
MSRYCPAGVDVAGYFGQAGLDGGGEPAVAFDHQSSAVAAGGDQQRYPHAFGGDGRAELLGQVQVLANVPAMVSAIGNRPIHD